MFTLLVVLFPTIMCTFGDIVVELPNGKIRGLQNTSFKNTTYYSFRRIPYAKPPVGQLRFKAPQPAEKWTGILDCTTITISCIQFFNQGLRESEDCLYINVYTPMLPNSGQESPLPVMVLLHGGGFIGGTSVDRMSDLLIENGVILVTMNYRLGAFGFLSTEDLVIPGNYGLKDQQLAMKWTYDNIRVFGGDPAKIVIFGESAGSASVAYQVLSPKSAGLFRGAICESGTAISPWAYQRNAREVAYKIAKYLNPFINNKTRSEYVLKYLQFVPASAIILASQVYALQAFGTTYFDFSIKQGLSWSPVIEPIHEGAFITEKMYKSLRDGNFNKVPLIIGFTSEESLGFHPVKLHTLYQMILYDFNLELLVPLDMKISDKNQAKAMGARIRKLYTNGEPFSLHLGDGIRFTSDNTFTRSIIRHAELASKYANMYFYQFSYDGVLGGNTIYYEGAEKVSHVEETRYIFCTGKQCDLSKYPVSDRVTSQRVVKMWTNFAKYLNPTPESSELLQNVTWPVVSTSNGDFLYLDINFNLIVKNHPKNRTYPGWVELYNSLGNVDFDTY